MNFSYDYDAASVRKNVTILTCVSCPCSCRHNGWTYLECQIVPQHCCWPGASPHGHTLHFQGHVTGHKTLKMFSKEFSQLECAVCRNYVKLLGQHGTKSPQLVESRHISVCHEGKMSERLSLHRFERRSLGQGCTDVSTRCGCLALVGGD